MQSLKVFIISRGIPTEENPMSGIFEWDQARALRDAGVKVSFIVLDLRSLRRKRDLRTRIFQREDINVVQGSMPLGAVPAPLLYHLGCMKLKSLASKAIRRFGRPDVMHGHFTDLGAISVAVARKLNIPCVVTEHSSALNLDVLASSTIYFARRAYSADRVITVSKRLRQRLLEHFGAESEVVANVVDVSAIRYVEKSEKIEKLTLFAAIGNLLPRKGHDLLAASFAALPESENARLIIIGDGPERENLQKQIDNLGLQDKITLAGRKSRAEISRYLNEADCFVLASNRETFGVVYIEAMLAGLPVIATRCGGPEDFVTDETGLLIDVGNRQQLTAALQKMIADHSKYSRRKIHDYAMARFIPEVIAARLIEIYKSIIKQCKQKFAI